MKKLGIVIADGVGYRNFILSDFLIEANNNFDEIIIYSNLIKKSYDISFFTNVKIVELESYNESKLSWFFRKLKEVAHLQAFNNHFGIKTSLKNGYPKKIRSKRDLLLKIIYFISFIFKNETSISFFEYLQFRTIRLSSTFKKCRERLELDNPDYLFFTHQRPAFLSPFLCAAKVCKIKTSTFIFSWDNLASKGRMMGTFDHYLVWSHLMESELLYFYPKTKSEAVHVVGTPQFEPYILDRYYKDKNYFVTNFQIDKNRKTIYYSCGDVSTSKLDGHYIEKIALAILNNKINQKVNFIVRTSPAEDGSRFNEIKKRYKFIIWNIPDWELTRRVHAEIWSQRVPQFRDICDLRTLLTYSDINVNMCSTMSLDFMLFNKPVINAVFGNDNNGLYNDQKYLKYGHYERVVNSGAVSIAKTEKELILALNEALNNPQKQEAERKTLLELQISKPLEGTSKRIAQVLKKLAYAT